MYKRMIVDTAAILSSALAHAERSDILLSVGVGSTARTFVGSNPSTDIPTRVNRSFSGFVKAGKLFGQKHAVYASAYMDSFTYREELLPSGYSSEYEANTQIFGLGYSYYFSPSPNSFYIEFGAGLVNLESGMGDSEGNSFLLGGGYEINEHLQAGSSLTLITTDDVNNSEQSYSSAVVGLNIELKLKAFSQLSMQGVMKILPCIYPSDETQVRCKYFE